MEFVQGGDLFTLLRRIIALDISMVSAPSCVRCILHACTTATCHIHLHMCSPVRAGAPFCGRNRFSLRPLALSRHHLPVSSYLEASFCMSVVQFVLRWIFVFSKHDAGLLMVHFRDLKPENILIDSDVRQ